MKVIELLYYMEKYLPLTIYYGKIPIISGYSQDIENELMKMKLDRKILDAEIKKIDLDGEKEELAIMIKFF